MLGLVAELCAWFERHGCRCHVGGSLASSFHGVPRQTRDIDLVVELTSSVVDDLVRDLGDAWYVDGAQARRALSRGRAFNLVHLESGWKVDVFPSGRTPFERSEMDRARPVAFDPGGRMVVPVKSPEDTILRKLSWFREGGGVSERQWNDVVGMLRTLSGELDDPYLEEWSRRLGVDDLLRQAREDAARDA